MKNSGDGSGILFDVVEKGPNSLTGGLTRDTKRRNGGYRIRDVFLDREILQSAV